MTEVRTSCDLTEYGHLLGMLDRDLRTIKFRIPQKAHHHHLQSKNAERKPTNFPATTVSSCRSSKSIKRHTNPWRVFQRLRNLLIFGVYLSFVHVPGASSAPIMAEESAPKWINPCNFSDSIKCDASSATPMSDLKRLIVNQAKNAFSRADHFKEEYVRSTFNTDFQSHHQRWKTQNYDWLPKLPKDLGEHLSDEYIKSLEVNKALIDIYESFQRIAVGLEQIAKDQKEYSGPFQQQFNETEYHLRGVLCEIQTAIVDHCLEMRPDITRAVMPDSLRHLTDNTNRNVRDWIIYRDYMNALEYAIQVFEGL